MISNSFNKTKAINSLILIASKIADSNGIADKYTALKMLYFAEVIHLAKYGRLITDDDIARLPHGSTPSKSYDLLKASSNDPNFQILSNEKFKPLSPIDMDELSESEVEALLQSYEQNKFFGFYNLKSKAHDDAYNMAKEKGLRFVPIEYIAKQEKLSAPEIAYIKEHYDFVESMQWLNL
ncbi:type II toxin-antitoxin system antitoxin SocA domain-containing protein [Mucilaginibacter psychrotolerans]|uniref:DUF4065 domain-containing protein n=1 Tax=Mucilaginibacter psychrotolerans TaxID=1524096 RepID=A0A4Y8SF78_9SPHI|nr:Panacea domain-containing protein [Mucilaginibacter psychrotolerans]TFF37094.1 DUF4065 domain-containing protein [Mucilaginibacter psychrotolerans]